MKKSVFTISIKKQRANFSVYCNDVCKGYGVSAWNIHNYYQMFILGIEVAGGKSELTDESFAVLNQATEIASSD